MINLFDFTYCGDYNRQIQNLARMVPEMRLPAEILTGSDITELFSNTLQTGSGYLMNAKSGVRSEFSQNFAGVFPRF